jgi:hypothetical protein
MVVADHTTLTIFTFPTTSQNELISELSKSIIAAGKPIRKTKRKEKKTSPAHCIHLVICFGSESQSSALPIFITNSFVNSVILLVFILKF